MSNAEAFDRLKMDFPIFEFRNTKSYPAVIDLIGDSVQANGFATIKVNSNQVYQVPDLSIFKLISPKMEDFIEYGVIGGKNNEDQAAEKSEENSEAVAAASVENATEVVPNDEKRIGGGEPVDDVKNKLTPAITSPSPTTLPSSTGVVSPAPSSKSSNNRR